MAASTNVSPTQARAFHSDAYTFDTVHFENLLNENSSRLFVPEGQMQIKVVESGQRDWIFTNETDLREYLQETTFKGLRIIFIPQRYSWDRLVISETALRLLLDRFKIFPAFIDILCAFGKLTSPSSDSLGGCYSWKRDDVTEFCCLLKNVEKHGREESSEPWSIRQLGLYHQHDRTSDSDTIIIINPMMSFQQRLKNAEHRTGSPPTCLDIHMLALSHATWQWRWYLNHWESQLDRLVSKAHVSEVKEPAKSDKMPAVIIDYGDFQDIQVIHDRMNMSRYILRANTRICECLEMQSPGVCKVGLLLEELRLQGTRVETLLERTRSGSTLMQDIISFRALDALKISSENSNELARLADIDSKNMVKLTSKSQRDAGKLTKITIVTMVYLPASFVAQFLSMGYLKVNRAKHPVSLYFASEMWVFAILTFILFAITFGLWLGLDTSGLKSKLFSRKQCEKKAADDKV